MTARSRAVRCGHDDRMPIYLGKYYDREEFPEDGIAKVNIRSDTIGGVEYCHTHGIVDRDTGARLGSVVDEKTGAAIGAVMAAERWRMLMAMERQRAKWKKRMTKESV